MEYDRIDYSEFSVSDRNYLRYFSLLIYQERTNRNPFDLIHDIFLGKSVTNFLKNIERFNLIRNYELCDFYKYLDEEQRYFIIHDKITEDFYKILKDYFNLKPSQFDFLLSCLTLDDTACVDIKKRFKPLNNYILKLTITDYISFNAGYFSGDVFNLYKKLELRDYEFPKELYKFSLSHKKISEASLEKIYALEAMATDELSLELLDTLKKEIESYLE